MLARCRLASTIEKIHDRIYLFLNGISGIMVGEPAEVVILTVLRAHWPTLDGAHTVTNNGASHHQPE
jgi:hypothetical protein